jgi:DNA polymerase I-like protein with 3'-5' exonuclease and polymerase domains
MRTLLIDRRNYADWYPILMEKFSTSNLVGIDLETEDSRRHDGLNRLMKVDEDGSKSSAAKLLFDVERTTITGLSLYADGDDTAYYFNWAHADVENRLTRAEVLTIVEAVRTRQHAWFIAHNAKFELTMLMNSVDYDLGERVICTLQLAVSCFNDDTYPMDEFLAPGLGSAFKRLLPAINREFAYYEMGSELTNEQEELLFKFIAKESTAEHSYNGYVDSIKYGYGLKRLSKKFLGYEQKTFAETLGDKAHMGQLTGDEVAAYGADDAWVCVHLYHKLMTFMLQTNPNIVASFFSQENPMSEVYSQVWRNGVVTNRNKVLEAQTLERAKVAQLFREMKANIRTLLPFPTEPHEKLCKYDEKLYGKSWKKYRSAVENWVAMPDSEDDFVQLYQCRTALSKQWAEERGMRESNGISVTYYQVVRCLVYDLCRCSFQLLEGKPQSDSEAQDRMRSRLVKKFGLVFNKETKEWFTPSAVQGDTTMIKVDESIEAEHRAVRTIQLLDDYKRLAGANQVIKLYINNYLNMIDPQTSRVYPILSSQLNSHRMALEAPNLSQLAKNSDMAYVRGFFEPDEADHVMVSADWSGVELVLIGDQSKDPAFAKAYAQRPHGDLHTETTAALLDLSFEETKALPDFKKKRTDIGKGGNFGYWYSGALGTVARELNLTSEQMWEYTDKYRTKFQVAEAWRVGVINQTKIDGFVVLPDGHKRYRYESTPLWASQMRSKFAQFGDAALKYGEICIKKIQTRSGNQAVNSLIQGTCATLAKRTILRMEKVIKDKGYRARFMFPVHDELVYSVHRADAVAFMKDLWIEMCERHTDIVTTLKLDASMAVGLNYWAWDKTKNPKGQIELDEASKLPCLPEERWGQKLTDEERQKCIDYLFKKETA